MASIVDIVGKYASGEMPLEGAVAILTTAFPINDKQARKFFVGIVPGKTSQEDANREEAGSSGGTT